MAGYQISQSQVLIDEVFKSLKEKEYSLASVQVRNLNDSLLQSHYVHQQH